MQTGSNVPGVQEAIFVCRSFQIGLGGPTSAQCLPHPPTIGPSAYMHPPAIRSDDDWMGGTRRRSLGGISEPWVCAIRLNSRLWRQKPAEPGYREETRALCGGERAARLSRCRLSSPSHCLSFPIGTSSRLPVLWLFLEGVRGLLDIRGHKDQLEVDRSEISWLVLVVVRVFTTMSLSSSLTPLAWPSLRPV
jgi:hypothetical protein